MLDPRTQRHGMAVALASLLFTSTDALAGTGHPFEFQERVGDPATFHVEGPACAPVENLEGDAMLTSVEFPSGDVFRFFYKPLAVHDVSYSGDETRWRIKGGNDVSVGLQGVYSYNDYDNDEFADLILEAFVNNNLHNLLDLNHSAPRFEITVEFKLPIMDNDPDPDDFGEILYFERGAGSGNSWLKMQAVDETGSPLGPWLVVEPDETVQTSPQTHLNSMSQTVGTTSIDVSRLGVTEVTHLRISNDVTGEPAYTGGGDLAPDFKIMAVMTNSTQIAQLMGAFD